MENSKNLSENIGEGEKEGMINSEKELRGFIELLSEVADGTRNEIYSLLISERWSHQEIAEKLIKAGQGWYVAMYLENFSGLDHKEIVDELIKAKQGWAVAYYLENFTEVDHKEIAYKLIKIGQGWAVAERLGKFSVLDHKEIVDELIKAKQGWAVAYYLENFTEVDHKEIAYKLIEAGNGENVAKYLGSFSGLNHREIADNLIKTKQGRAVAYHLGSFTEVDHKEIAYKLIEAGYGRAVTDNLEKFSERDHQEIAYKLIEAGDVWAVTDNLEKFSERDHQEIANKLIEVGYDLVVADNLESFTGLDKEIVLKLLNHGNQEAQITAAKYFIKKDLRKEKELKSAEGGLVLKTLKALGMDFYISLSKCWSGEKATGVIKKQYFDFEAENITEKDCQILNQIHALVMAAEKIMKEKEREKLDELKGKYNVDTEKQKIINTWNKYHRELEDQAGNLLRDIVNGELRKAYIEWRENEVSEWFCERDKVA